MILVYPYANGYQEGGSFANSTSRYLKCWFGCGFGSYQCFWVMRLLREGYDLGLWV